MKRSLDISFFGASLVSAHRNPAATYYRGIVRALADRGHHVTFYEPDALDRQKHRDIEDPPYANVVVYSGTDQGAALTMLERVRSSDVIVKGSGVGVFDELLEREVPRARHRGALAVFWDVDAPATLERVRSTASDPFRALVPRYDLVLTRGGGAAAMKSYRELGARSVTAIHNALDPSTHFPVATDPRWIADLSLLANRPPPAREAAIDEHFFRVAYALPQRTFLLGGSGWESKKLPPNVTYVGAVETADHNALNTSATCVLDVTCDGAASGAWSPATRVFEAAGAAACIITDAWEGVGEFLTPGQEILAARDGADVVRYLEGIDRKRTRRIGLGARHRVLGQHTYGQRARLVETLFMPG